MTHEKKPQELAPFEEYYKQAKKELIQYMRTFNEYTKENNNAIKPPPKPNKKMPTG